MTATERSRRLLEEATDIVAIVGGVSRERARAVLHVMSAHTSIKERHVAELLVEWAVSGRLPAELRQELGQQLAERAAPAAAPATGPAAEPAAP